MYQNTSLHGFEPGLQAQNNTMFPCRWLQICVNPTNLKSAVWVVKVDRFWKFEIFLNSQDVKNSEQFKTSSFCLFWSFLWTRKISILDWFKAKFDARALVTGPNSAKFGENASFDSRRHLIWYKVSFVIFASRVVIKCNAFFISLIICFCICINCTNWLFRVSVDFASLLFKPFKTISSLFSRSRFFIFQPKWAKFG